MVKMHKKMKPVSMDMRKQTADTQAGSDSSKDRSLSNYSTPGTIEEDECNWNNKNDSPLGKDIMNSPQKTEKSPSDASTQDCSSPSTSFQRSSWSSFNRTATSSLNRTINLHDTSSEIQKESTIDDSYLCFEIQSRESLNETTCHTCGCSRRNAMERVCFCDSCMQQGCLFKLNKKLFVDEVGRDLPLERTQLPKMIHPALEASTSVVGFDDEMEERIRDQYGLKAAGKGKGNSVMANLTEFSLFVDAVEEYGRNVPQEVSKSFKGLSRKNMEKLEVRKEMIRDLRHEYRNNYSKKCKRGYWLTIVNLKADNEKRRLWKRAEKRTRTRNYARDAKADREWARELWEE